MANSIAKLAILLTTDTSGVRKGFADARQQTLSLNNTMNGLTRSVGTLALGFVTLQTATRMVQWMSDLAAQSERVRTTLEGVAGSAANAKMALADMQGRPLFDLEDQNKAARTLLATGTSIENLKNKMDELGDVAIGSGNSMELVADMLAKVKTDGKLAAGELTLFAKVGIPLQQQLAKQLGITTDEVMKLAQEGRISAEETERAFQLMTRAGGAFHNANSKMLQTTTGEWKQFKDTVETGARGIGTSFNLGVRNVLRLANQTLGAWGIAGEDPFKKFRESQEKTIRTTNSLGHSVTSFKSVLTGGRVTLTLIDPKPAQNYAKAMEKAKEEVKEQLKATRQIRDIQREVSVGAHSRDTASGMSGVFQAILTMRHNDAMEKEQLAAQKENNRLTQLQLDVMKKEKPQVTIKAVGHL